jgi:hypothetical protein
MVIKNNINHILLVYPITFSLHPIRKEGTIIMKKLLLVLGLVFALTACNAGKSTTASYITVVDKGSTDNNQQWITVKQSDNKPFKIAV